MFLDKEHLSEQQETQVSRAMGETEVGGTGEPGDGGPGEQEDDLKTQSLDGRDAIQGDPKIESGEPSDAFRRGSKTDVPRVGAFIGATGNTSG